MTRNIRYAAIQNYPNPRTGERRHPGGNHVIVALFEVDGRVVDRDYLPGDWPTFSHANKEARQMNGDPMLEVHQNL